MLSLKPNQFHPLPLLNSPAATRPSSFLHQGGLSVGGRRGLVLTVKCAGEEEKKGQRSFLSPEEAGLVEVSGLSTHERFLCRLTVDIITESVEGDIRARRDSNRGAQCW
ncbi:uncharacterized protein LOC109844844 isoform X3 [Asparagus officinalis]|uniref:uncharacterized protein LOC109844844 isoform X3 n=1 Tax=Asparagus officinalis TaxID=4686 RepID=UPI00098E1C76|nr:uncharacterized protein LOC109844844 isoform X3 [Asparagus officinalis]